MFMRLLWQPMVVINSYRHAYELLEERSAIYSDHPRLTVVEEVDFGPRLLDKSKVETMLRRAQAAVLNPSRPLSEFLAIDERDKRLTTKEENQYQFSRNVVCVDLTGPDLGDLSFVDLPGTSRHPARIERMLIEQ